MTVSALSEPFSANQDAHRREWGSQWEGLFSKDLYFELPEQDHEALEVSVIWNIIAILNIYTQTSESPALGFGCSARAVHAV